MCYIMLYIIYTSPTIYQIQRHPVVCCMVLSPRLDVVRITNAQNFRGCDDQPRKDGRLTQNVSVVDQESVRNVDRC